MPTWPSKFCPLAGSFQESPPNSTIRSSMDKGPDKIRRRTTANIRPVQFNILISRQDTQELDTFYDVETVGGSLPFDFVHPRTEQIVEARFVNPPQYTDRKAGQKYHCTIELEILP